MVDESGRAELVLDASHDVEIRHTGLDHDHVGALGQVQGDLMQGLVRIGGIHLVVVLIARAQVACGADGVAEGTIIARGILGGVGEDACVDVALGLQRGADGADPSVHHVRGCDDVGSGLRMGDRLADQDLDRLVVRDVAGLVDQAVLAVRGEGIERHIGDDPEIRYRSLQRTYRALRKPVGIERLACVERLDLRRGDRKERHGRDAEPLDLDRVLHQQIDAQTLDPRHGGDRLALPGAFQHEDRIDEVVRGQGRLAHHATREGVPTHPAHAGDGEIGTMGVTIGHGMASRSAPARPGPPRRSGPLQ